MTSETSSPNELERLALKAFREGRLDEAIQTFTIARQAFLAEGNDVKAAEMASNLSVVLLKAERPEEALEAATGTPDIFIQSGDQTLAAQALGNLGSALEACGDLDGAENAYRQAADLFESLGETEHQRYTIQALSHLQLRLGRPLEALTSMQHGLESQSRSGVRDRLLRWLLKLPNRFMGR
ncbi:MAG: tetratricopeptide repeat protein [Anaerolineaceae bacterium]|nr:MAG: tetratricopeptide repeat protein [Anaerolineaceae bacterium]